MKRVFIAAMILAGLCLVACEKETTGIKVEKKKAAPEEPVVVDTIKNHVFVGYVTYWDTSMPPIEYVTHINYAFAHVAKTFDKIEIKSPSRLQKFVNERKKHPEVKLLLSIGGWEAGNFSEMAASETYRKSFCKSCLDACVKYGLDGIDLDWEYPTSSAAGISSSPQDTKNFTLLLKDMREAIGDDRLLTMASSSSAKYVDFKSCIQYMDFVNLMTYDMGDPPKHNAGLYSSSMTHRSIDESVQLHKNAGVPYNKIVIGVPFFGRKKDAGSSLDYNEIDISKYTRKWDDKAKVPYLVDASGTFIISYDDPESVRLKGEYALQKNLLGVMVWNLEADDKNWTLTKTLHDSVFPNK